MRLYDVIRRPLVTEKSTRQREGFNQYGFVVDLRATKHDVHKAIEGIFKVKVVAVTTVCVRGKMRRRGAQYGKLANFKKAFVTLEKGAHIELFEGV